MIEEGTWRCPDADGAPGNMFVPVGTEVQELGALRKQLWSGPGVEREVTLDVRRDEGERRLVLRSVGRASALRKPAGV